MATLAKNTVATCESLAAMGDLVSKLVAKNTAKNKHILDGDLAIRKRKKTEAVEKKKEVEKKKRRVELVEKGRVTKDDASTVLSERSMNKIATKGVIQLFNAVRTQQKDLDTKLKKAKTENQVEKIQSKVSTGSFLDLMKPKVKPEDGEKDQKWGVLKDDFMMGAKVKDWDKEIEEGEEESDGDEKGEEDGSD